VDSGTEFSVTGMGELLELMTEEQLPQNDIKAIFFDVDGTLLGLDGSYSSATKLAIKNIKEKDIKAGIASGRPYFAARHIVYELGLDDLGIFCAGASLYLPSQNRVLSQAELPRKTATTVIACLRTLNVHYEIYTSEHYYIEQNNLDEIRRVHTQHLRCDALDKDFDSVIAESSVIKLLAAVNSRDKFSVLHDLEKRFPSLDFAYAGIAAYPDWLFVSITDPSACREKAFAKMLTFHGIAASQVMSFGDAQSDCVFLKNAGIGVAMGNAGDEVKAIADIVTKPVWDDGIAYALSRLIS
jgi:Cof subfamily protein (haloacid dehalogenase superfamily)